MSARLALTLFLAELYGRPSTTSGGIALSYSLLMYGFSPKFKRRPNTFEHSSLTKQICSVTWLPFWRLPASWLLKERLLN